MDAKVRPARPSDRQPLMSFIKDVWGGTDYIPHVWDQWLKDPRGKMFVVELGGSPVGMSRIRFLEDGSAWFEGVRIHPDFRGRGLASLLGDNSMRTAKKLGITTYRLTSGSHNHAAHRQIARINFKEIARFSVYEPPKGMKVMDRRAAKEMRASDIAEVVNLIEKTSEFELAKGVFWHDFTAASLTPDVIKILVNEGAVHVSGGAVAITREGGEGSEIWEEFCFVGGPVDDALKLIDATIGWSKNADVRWVFLPQRSPIIRALRIRGFERNFSMVLFERRAANG